MTQNTKPSGATRDAERTEAKLPHEPDRPANEEESKLAEGHKTNPETAKNAKEMAERGANQKGEGRI